MSYSLYLLCTHFKGQANVEKGVTILYSLFLERISEICRRHEGKYFFAVYLQHK
jgi:hypothetical protein